MFKKVVLAVFITAISSCGFCQQEVQFSFSKEAPVEIIEEQKNSKKGVVLYSPDIPVSESTIDFSKEEICDYEIYRYTVEPFEIKEKVIQNVYVNINREFATEVILWIRNKAQESKYIFLYDNLIYTAAGDSLEFIDWAIVDIYEHEIMWEQEFNGFDKKMSFDGTINLRDYLTQEKVIFNLNGRGRSPSQRTYIGFHIDLIFLSNCEET